MSDHDDSYALISTTRYDPYLIQLNYNNDPGDNPSPFFLLSYHIDRIIDAANRHGWQRLLPALDFAAVKSLCEQAVPQHSGMDGPNSCRVRLVLGRDGNLQAFTFPASPFSADPFASSLFNPATDSCSLFGPIMNVFMDNQPTPSSIFTSTKTTRRAHYEEARARVGVPPFGSDPPPQSDVILYNPLMHITEASVCNVAFHRTSRWVTPPASTGCLPGVARRWLLEQARIYEAEEGLLTTDTVAVGDWVLLMNGVIGCRLGKIIASGGMPVGCD